MLVLAVSACTEPNTPAADQKELSNEPSSPTLAEVNGEAITQADVEFLIERTFSSTDRGLFDQQVQSKVLESLIASKAMKHHVESQLSAEALSVMQRKVKAYEEELFVKEYLIKNAEPQPVSTQMVKDYYESHLEEFGGGESRVFEMLKTSTTPNEQQRDKILEAVSLIKQNANWPAYAKQTSAELGLVFFRSTMQPGLLDAALENALKSLNENKVSDVVFVDGVPHILRVTEVQTRAPESLSSVSAGIRKKLAALQLKKAVKKASEQVVQQANIKMSQ